MAKKYPSSKANDFRGRILRFQLLPVVQFWQLSFKVGSDLLWGPGFIRHMTFQKIQQFLKARVNEFPVGITPLAVLLVKGAVRLPADIGVLQGHTAALADQLPGRTQQGVDGDIKQPGEEFQSFCVGHRFVGLPLVDRLTGSHALVPPTAPGRVRAWCSVSEGFLWVPC